MNTRVRSYLIDVARNRTAPTTTYQRLSDECNLGLQMQEKPSDRNTLATILEEISVFEHQNSRPLLSSLVLRASDNQEGDGFYKLAEKLGFGDWQALKRGEFAITQINECIAYWTDNNNFTTNS